ncbi:MAG: hypothetical protein AAF355_01225 [Myxococcota bacterium]
MRHLGRSLNWRQARVELSFVALLTEMGDLSALFAQTPGSPRCGLTGQRAGAERAAPKAARPDL